MAFDTAITPARIWAPPSYTYSEQVMARVLNTVRGTPYERTYAIAAVGGALLALIETISRISLAILSSPVYALAQIVRYCQNNPLESIFSKIVYRLEDNFALIPESVKFMLLSVGSVFTVAIYGSINHEPPSTPHGAPASAALDTPEPDTDSRDTGSPITGTLGTTAVTSHMADSTDDSIPVTRESLLDAIDTTTVEVARLEALCLAKTAEYDVAISAINDEFGDVIDLVNGVISAISHDFSRINDASAMLDEREHDSTRLARAKQALTRMNEANHYFIELAEVAAALDTANTNLRNFRSQLAAFDHSHPSD